MKKVLTISILAVILMMSMVSVVSAATKDTLAQTLYDMGAKYGMTSADRVKVERYLSENPVTDDEADAVVAKAKEAVAVMEKAGVTDVSKLTAAQKEELKAIAVDAASIVDVKLVFKAKSVEVYKDGKLIETVTSNNGTLAYTGNSVNVVLVVSMVAVVALSLIAVARKKLANA